MTTRKDVERSFARFVRAIGGEVATATHGAENVGKYFADYAPTYGGYVVKQVSEGGGESDAFGVRRRSPAAFVDVLDFATDALRATQ